MIDRPQPSALRASVAWAMALAAVLLATPRDALAQLSPASSAQPLSVAPGAQGTTQSVYAQPGPLSVRRPAVEVVDESGERDVRAYRAPLAIWYGVALGATWLPVLAASNCRGYGCLGVLAGPALRVGFGFAPPIVHWRRGRIGRGFLSLGGQAAAVAIGASIGSAADKYQCESSNSDEGECPFDVAPFLGWFIADVVWAATDVLLTPNSVDLTPQHQESAACCVPGFTAANNRWLLTLQGQLE